MLEDIAELAPVREKRKAFLLIYRAFATLWREQAISTPGTSVLHTTLVLWIATVRARPASRAPLAGACVDRREKRWTMALRAVLIGLLFLLALTGKSGYPTWFLLTMSALIVVLTTSCSPFFGPVRLAVPGDLVDEQSSARSGDSKSRWSLSARVRKVPFDRCARLLFHVSQRFAWLEPSLPLACQNLIPYSASCSATSVFYEQYRPDHAFPGDLSGDAGSRSSSDAGYLLRHAESPHLAGLFWPAQHGARERSLLVLSAGIDATLTLAKVRDVSTATKTASSAEEG